MLYYNCAMESSILMAFDKSMRTIDHDGRLRVAISNISKATVNPYLGREIPGSNALNLQPDRIYYLLRCPQELAASVDTFNNIPILNLHVPVTADEPRPELVVGSTGTECAFDGQFLQNSLTVWDARAISGIEDLSAAELSCAYRYRADMTPGTFEGVAYDGVMRDIKGNHVALVSVGRAGPDVYVFDSQPTEISFMKRSKLAVALHAALGAYIAPLLAQDAKLTGLDVLVKDAKRVTFAQDSARIISAVEKQSAGKLSGTIDAAALGRVLSFALDAAGDEEDEKEIAKDEGDDEDDEAAKKKKLAADAEADEDNKKAAMDSAIAKVKADTLREMRAILQAQKDVAPHIGEIVAQDSAAAVYKLALDAADVDVTGVDPSAYRTLVSLLQKPGANIAKPTIAQDSANVSDFAKRFPNAVAPSRS